MPEGIQPPPDQPPPPPPNPPPPNPPPPPPPPPPNPPATFREAVGRLLTPSVLVHAGLVVFLILLVVLVHWLSKGKAEYKAKLWLCEADVNIYGDCKKVLDAYAPTPTPSPTPTATPTPDAANRNTATPNINTADATPTPTPPPTATPTTTEPPSFECGEGPYKIRPDETKRLQEQLREIKGLAVFHADVMRYFFVAYYIAITMMLFSGVLLAIALFFIAQDGWGPTNSYVKTLFVVMAAVTAYYGLFPPVFQQQKNITDNTALFLEYQTLRREVESYPLTCTPLTGGDLQRPASFVNYVNSEMKRLGKIAIGFDYSKIDYKAAFEINRDRATTGGTQKTEDSTNPGP